MSAARIVHADCLTALRDMPDASVDAVVTDPPYGLSNTTPAQVADTITRWVSGDREYLPTGRGFMGHEWDGFVPPVAVWDECLRVLKPGGHLLAFAGSRTHDLMTLGIRLAGFEIRDSVAWLYGSGFPKSLDVSKAIDKAGGDPLAFRRFAHAYAEAVSSSSYRHSEIDRHLGVKSSSCYWARADHRGGLPPRHHWDKVRDLLGLPAELEALYDEAEREVIGVKKGAMSGWSMDGTTQFVDRDVTAPATDAARQWEGWGTALKPAFEPVTLARKPLTGTVAANVQEHGTGALNIDACRIYATDDDRALMEARSHPNGTKAGSSGGGIAMQFDKPHGFKSHPSGRWPANVVLDESQAAELDRQSGNVKTGATKPHRRDPDSSPMFKVGKWMTHSQPASEGGASRFFKVIEHDAPFMYCAKAPKSERPVVDGVAHSTVKPVTLMRWLVRMVTPPGGTVLDPFAGSGTTLEAAMLEGFNAVGVEREADYLPLIHARIERATTTLAAQAEAEGDTLFPIDGAAS